MGNAARREQLKILDELGVVVEEERRGRGGHSVMYCRAGATRFCVTVMMSPSDHRSLLNWKAQVKRAMRGAR